MLIPEAPLLALRARVTPDAPALVDATGAIGWRELASRVGLAASALRAAGVRAGDGVALLHANGARFVELVHAVEACGAVLLPLNPRWTPAELAHPLAEAKPRLLVHDARHAAPAEAAATAAGIPRAAAEALRPDATERDARPIALAPDAPVAFAPDAPIALAPDAPFAILYTSGTSGRPKGALLPRSAVLWSALASGLHLGASPADRWLACLPLQHVGGLSILVRSALSGAAVVVHERFDPERVAHALHEEQVSHVSFVARMLEQVLATRRGARAPQTLRCVLVGGGPAPEVLLARAARAGYPVAPTYGLTETCSQVATRAPGAPAETGLRPLLGYEVRIGAGSSEGEGEIQVRSPALMRGYLGDAAASARALREGWLHTGDIGRLDARGDLHVLARRSDLVVSGGENVYPAEVEAALEVHADVAEAGVAGRADAGFGQRPEAWLVLRAGARLDVEALRAHCRARLAGYKLPVAFHVVTALPRDAAGKLVRRRLGGV